MEFGLTDEQRELRDLAREFGREEVRPVALEFDQHADPAKCHPDQLFKRADELGLRTMSIPREFGGRAADCLTEVLVLEELCTADVGFGMTLQHAWREGYCLSVLTTDYQRSKWLDDFLADPLFYTSTANSEPEVGSDKSAGYYGDLEAGYRTKAVRDGDDWTINGQKRWLTNGSVARLYFVSARTDKSVPWNKGSTVFFVPADTPGVTQGKVENKLGVRTNLNAEVYFDNVVVPHEHVFGAVNGAQGIREVTRLGSGTKAKTAAKCLGVARAAYEELVSQVDNGAVPVDQELHDALAIMSMEIESTRSLMWRAAWAVENDATQGAILEKSAFNKASEVADCVVRMALKFTPPESLRRGSHMEKLARDAACMLHAGGGKHAMRARVGRDILATFDPMVTLLPASATLA